MHQCKINQTRQQVGGGNHDVRQGTQARTRCCLRAHVCWQHTATAARLPAATEERATAPLPLQGSSKGENYAEQLQPIRLNEHDVDWEAADLSYLEPQTYKRFIQERLEGAIWAAERRAGTACHSRSGATQGAGLSLCKLQGTMCKACTGQESLPQGMPRIPQVWLFVTLQVRSWWKQSSRRWQLLGTSSWSTAARSITPSCARACAGEQAASV